MRDGDLDEARKEAEAEALAMLRRAGVLDACTEIASKNHASLGEVLGESRRKRVAHARHEVQFFLHEVRRPGSDDRAFSYPDIAIMTARGDHTTVISAVKKIRKLRAAQALVDVP